MVTAGTQKKRVAAEKKEAAAARSKVGEELAKSQRRTKAKEANITAEQIVAERETKGLSWAQVAINLDLGSPGAARNAYTKLTGKDHSESQMNGKRAKRGTGARNSVRKLHAPNWDDDSDQDDILQKLQGNWHDGFQEGKDWTPGHFDGSAITVNRKLGDNTWVEELRVRKVVRLTFGKNGDQPLQVELVENGTGAHRAFFASEIVSVR